MNDVLRFTKLVNGTSISFIENVEKKTVTVTSSNKVMKPKPPKNSHFINTHAWLFSSANGAANGYLLVPTTDDSVCNKIKLSIPLCKTIKAINALSEKEPAAPPKKFLI